MVMDVTRRFAKPLSAIPVPAVYRAILRISHKFASVIGSSLSRRGSHAALLAQAALSLAALLLLTASASAQTSRLWL
jgi:hypothetical protein